MHGFAGNCAKLRHFEIKNAYKTLTLIRFVPTANVLAKGHQKSTDSAKVCNVFPVIGGIVKHHDINRAALIDQIQQARETLEKLLALLQSAPVERGRFVSPLYQARRDTDERVNCRKVGQANRAMCHLELPDCRKHGL
jgi:hypothetical protein